MRSARIEEGEHQDVHELRTGSGTEGVEPLSEHPPRSSRFTGGTYGRWMI
jgi:hypothetical protein